MPLLLRAESACAQQQLLVLSFWRCRICRTRNWKNVLNRNERVYTVVKDFCVLAYEALISYESRIPSGWGGFYFSNHPKSPKSVFYFWHDWLSVPWRLCFGWFWEKDSWIACWAKRRRIIGSGKAMEIVYQSWSIKSMHIKNISWKCWGRKNLVHWCSGCAHSR